MFDRESFEREKRQNAEAQVRDTALQELAHRFIVEADRHSYEYQWSWLGLPMIQLPADILALQEIVWETKPDVIVETGVAWGGSTVFYASLLQLLGKGMIIGIDLNLMDHVTKSIMSYPFSDRIHLLRGSSVDAGMAAKIKALIAPGQSVMVVLDSHHTHEHVLDELRLYAPLVTKGNFLVVCDTIVETTTLQPHRPRPWGRGNNPHTALEAFLKESDRFERDQYVNGKVVTSLFPGGYVRCVK
jgi:cephalosporin hydroxylase